MNEGRTADAGGMTGALRVSALIDETTRRLSRVADFAVLAALLISAANAISRYAASYSSNAFLEIQWYLFGAMVLLGGAHTLRLDGHVRVDVVYGSLSERARLKIDVFGLVLFLLPVCLLLTALSIPFFWHSLLSGERSNNAGGLILWPAKLPLGFGLMTLQGVSELIKRIAALRGATTGHEGHPAPPAA